MVAGKTVYFTLEELKWIVSTMMNQDNFENVEDEKTSESIKNKAMKALEASK